MMGPEHEFSIVNDELRILPIVDRVIRDFRGRAVNLVEFPKFTFGKELQAHVIEIKANNPFRSPEVFEETMQEAVLTMLDFLESKYNARLLGLGMHPLLKLDETMVWQHRHRQIYKAYEAIFSLKQHGWLNIQSFQLNIPYEGEEKAVILHDLLANIVPYLPAISASSPVYEGKIGEYVDNRLFFYMTNQKEIPSVTGDVVPEYITSLKQYRKEVIERYSLDLAGAKADKCLLHKEWVNSRGVIFRFDRKALEVRVFDEQECIKSDVALSCFVRALLRGLIRSKTQLLPHSLLVEDFKSVIRDGLDAKVLHPGGPTARAVCKQFYGIAYENASEEERKYLPVIAERIERGSLSEIVRERILVRAQKTDFHEAVSDVYSQLVKNLSENKPYF